MVQRACHGVSLEHFGSLPRKSTNLLAPAWHTRALVALLLLVAATGLLLEPAVLQASSKPSSNAQAYLLLVLVNALLCVYASGVGVQRNLLAELLVQPRHGNGRWLGELGVGFALAAALIAAESSLQWSLGLPESLAAHDLMPSGTAQKLAWLPVAACVGFAEELVYRGYLQRQLTAMSGWLPWGVLLQALLFGIAHGEQGAAAALRFAIYGLVFGAVAAWRRSLLAGVLAHVLVDWLAAFG